MEIRTFSAEHIEQTVALSAQVGWNHLPQDWQRCIDLNPRFCLAGFEDRKLVATTTVSKFGDLGWMGTFIVDKDHQKKGYGSMMLQAGIQRAQADGMNWFALDSSDVGRPIYTRFGFVLDEPIERWTGPGAAGDAGATQPLVREHWPGLLAMDRKVTGVDRERQLRHLAAEPGAAVRVLLDGDAIAAYGFSRPGRLSGSIGPLVAQDDAAAAAIFEALLADRRAIDGDRGIALDLLGHDSFKTYLAEKGCVMRRRNIRMFLPTKKRPVLSGPSVYFATGLGMG
jgi:GNAT superfamily N-acetyltransferase